jgi:hypothetical protein
MEHLGVPASRADQKRFENAEYNELPLRILTTTVTADGRLLSVQVAEPMDDYFEALERFRTAMFIGIPVLLVFAGGGRLLDEHPCSTSRRPDYSHSPDD